MGTQFFPATILLLFYFVFFNYNQFYSYVIVVQLRVAKHQQIKLVYSGIHEVGQLYPIVPEQK